METEKESDLLTKTPKAQYRWANDELVATTLNGISPQISEPLMRHRSLWYSTGRRLTTGDQALVTGGTGMGAILHALLIGSVDSFNTVREALRKRYNCQISVGTGVWDLCAIPQQQKSFDIAILHDTLPQCEVRKASEYIRRRWPRTRILVISVEAEVLDDPLYDEWMTPDRSPDFLFAMIEQLTGG